MSMKRVLPLLCAVLLMAASVGPLRAVQPDEVLPNPAQEARARTLSKELRCMVCQNQSIDDSDAPLAKDLRILVRERIKAGDSNDEVLDYLVSRYGEFVLMRPTWHGTNWILWLAPFLVLAVGGVGLAVAYRRRRAPVPQAPLSAEEESQLRQLLDTEARRDEGQGNVTNV